MILAYIILSGILGTGLYLLLGGCGSVPCENMNGLNLTIVEQRIELTECVRHRRGGALYYPCWYGLLTGRIDDGSTCTCPW